jgi:hypothetical protein
VTNYRSHVDPCQFIRWIYAPPGAISKQTLEELMDASPSDRERLFKLWRNHSRTTPRLIFHETYHYWQGLRLPFLLWYAIDVNRKMFLAFRELAKVSQDWASWDAILPEFFYLSVSFRCSNLGNAEFVVNDGSIEAPPGVIDSVLLSPLDLLEGATSFAEWQAFTPTTDDAVSALSFNRWCKRNPSYTSAYKFVARAVGDSIAVSCFSHLVAASFESNRPVHTFGGLLANLVGYLRDADFRNMVVENAPRNAIHWKVLFNHFLDELIEFEAQPNAEFGVRPDQPYFRLTLDSWVQGSFNESGYGHPFLSPLARKWADLAAHEPIFQEVLTSFRWLGEEVWNVCMQQFEPPLTVVRFDLEDGSSRVLTIDAQNGGIDTQGLHVADIFTMYSTIKAATGAFFSEGQRLCTHRQCSHFQANRCNSYPFIPIEFSQCVYPHRAKQLIGILRNERSK